MAYTPPEEDNVNFDLSGGYTAPEEDAVDFDFTSGITISAPATTVSVTTPNPSVTPGTATVSAPATSVATSTPAPTVEAVTTVSAPVTSVATSTPSPSVDMKVVVEPPTTSVSVTTPSPAVKQSTTTLDVGDGSVGTTGSDTSVVGVDTWAIEGMEFGTVTGVSLTHKQITITYLLTESELKQIRSWVEDSGKFRRTVEYGGHWRVIDTSIRGNEFVLSPPVDERPPHDHYRVVVDKLDDTPESRSGDRHEVRLTAVLSEPIGVGHSDSWQDETAASDEWLFEFLRGGVATSNVSRDLTRKDTGGKGSAVLNLVMSADEAGVLVESARYVDATRTVEISDGTSRSEDTSMDGGNTVTITPPTNGDRFIEQGTYVIVGWEVQRVNSNAYRVKLDVNSQL